MAACRTPTHYNEHLNNETMKNTRRNYYETGLCDKYAWPLNELDRVKLIAPIGFGVKEYLGNIEFYQGQFIVRYDDLSEDPLWEVHANCEIVKPYDHTKNAIVDLSGIKSGGLRIADTISTMLEIQNPIIFYKTKVPFIIKSIEHE